MTPTKIRRMARGSVLLECVGALTLLFPATILSVEYARRGWIDPALASASCAIARDLRWGHRTTRAFQRADAVFQSAFAASGRTVLRRSAPASERRGQGAKARVHWRAPLLWAFSVGDKNHHHFEVTHQCLSP